MPPSAPRPRPPHTEGAGRRLGQAAPRGQPERKRCSVPINAAAHWKAGPYIRTHWRVWLAAGISPTGRAGCTRAPLKLLALRS